MFSEDEHRAWKRKLEELRFAQASAEGSLRGHVTFMLQCHEHDMVNELQWQRLRQYRDGAQLASAAVTDHVFSMPELV